MNMIWEVEGSQGIQVFWEDEMYTEQSKGSYLG